MKPYQCVFWLLLFCSLIAVPALADSKEATILPGRAPESVGCAMSGQMSEQIPWTISYATTPFSVKYFVQDPTWLINVDQQTYPGATGVDFIQNWAAPLDSVGAQPWTGACCNPLTGECTITLESDCAYDWLGLDVPCTLENCPIPPLPEGACCNQATGVCTITAQAACDLPSIWLGAGVPCNAETCQPVSPTERTSWGQIKSLYR
jgi:hypothetical protein